MMNVFTYYIQHDWKIQREWRSVNEGALEIIHLKLHKSTSYLLIMFAHTAFIAGRKHASLQLIHLQWLFLQIPWYSTENRVKMLKRTSTLRAKCSCSKWLLFVMQCIYTFLKQSYENKIIANDIIEMIYVHYLNESQTCISTLAWLATCSEI